MKPRSIVTIGLLAFMLMAGCAPGAPPAPAQTVPPELPAPLESEPTVLPSPAPAEGQPREAVIEVPPTEPPAEVPQVVATSRGPGLEATDPSTVSLASGDLQLVEFFRFT